MKAIVALPPTLVGGEHVSKDAARGLTSTVLRYDNKQFGLAARFYADAFCTLPRLAGDLKAWHRYNAACYASLAAAARGAGVPNFLDDKQGAVSAAEAGTRLASAPTDLPSVRGPNS